MKSKYIFPLFLILITAGIYFRSADFPFINYDNNEYIIENPLLGSWNPDSFRRIWQVGGVPEENLYIPLTYTSYFIETALAGKQPALIHINNIILHIINVLLLYWFARRIKLSGRASFFTAAAFAFHPLQVEPVVWCMGRKDLLSTFFAFLAIHFYLNSIKGNKKKWLFFLLFSSAAAMFAKPVMVILPGILLLEEILLYTNADDKNDNSIAARLSALLRAIKLKSTSNMHSLRVYTILAVSVLSGMIVFFNLSGPFRAPGNRPLNEIAACYIYLTGEWIRRLFLLEPVQHIYRWPDTSVLFDALPGSLIIIAVSLAALSLALIDVKYDRRMLFGLFFAFVAFIPPLMHLRYSQDFITADRYGYFPAAGMFLGFSVLITSGSGLKQRILLAFAAFWLGGMALKAVDTVDSWSSNVLFWRNEVSIKPDSPRDNYFYGLALLSEGKYPEALAAYDICIKHPSPYLQRALFSSGSAYFYLGNYGKALEMYKKALEADTESEYVSLIYSSMAEVYLKKKNVKMALGMLQKALEENPEDADAHLRISQIYLYLDKNSAAAKHIRKAAGLGADIPENLHRFLTEKP